ncbi:hypothetical protein BJ878DRAFT_518002 [Calycina marina]|uniref:Uncharacterized protein n=1 Tax=Calycina marina TaxID=1763456 RepID=A0A9P7YYF2_9HELO|nr:hypothetical protein BJ878DRAFT_518002 [Calycina marina]
MLFNLLPVVRTVLLPVARSMILLVGLLVIHRLGISVIHQVGLFVALCMAFFTHAAISSMCVSSRGRRLLWRTRTRILRLLRWWWVP